jgi:hypothetical protein
LFGRRGARFNVVLIAKEVIMSALRPFTLGSVGVVGAALLCAYLFAAESPTPAVKVPDLSQRVATLEERVARLEKLLAERPALGTPLVAPQSPYAPPTPPTPQPAQPMPQLTPSLPRNAVPFDFNGQTYYIVPLAQQAAQK